MLEKVGTDCSRCGACVQVCPAGCISMDQERAWIDSEKCLHCDACRKHCHLLAKVSLNTVQKAYAAQAEDGSVRSRSASGGAFAAIARSFLEQGGVVFGSAWQEDWRAKHIGVESADALFKLQGSKYTESDTGDTYARVKQALREGKPVLYSGTPCQIAGLYAFFGKKPEKLYTADIVCHGVPRGELLAEYIAYYEKKHGCRVTEWNFRAHKEGIQGCLGRITYEKDGRIKTVPMLWNCDTYYYHFMHGLCYQSRCYTCPYAQRQRTGDVTLADFWGIERLFPHRVGGNTSLVLVNTEAGAGLLAQCRGLQLTEADTEAACAQNGQLNAPVKRTAEKDRFEALYVQGGWGAVEQDFLKKTRLQRLKAQAVYRIPAGLKKQLRNLRRR